MKMALSISLGACYSWLISNKVAQLAQVAQMAQVEGGDELTITWDEVEEAASYQVNFTLDAQVQTQAITKQSLSKQSAADATSASYSITVNEPEFKLTAEGKKKYKIPEDLSKYAISISACSSDDKCDLRKSAKKTVTAIAKDLSDKEQQATFVARELSSAKFNPIDNYNRYKVKIGENEVTQYTSKKHANDAIQIIASALKLDKDFNPDNLTFYACNILRCQQIYWNEDAGAQEFYPDAASDETETVLVEGGLQEEAKSNGTNTVTVHGEKLYINGRVRKDKAYVYKAKCYLDGNAEDDNTCMDSGLLNAEHASFEDDANNDTPAFSGVFAGIAYRDDDPVVHNNPELDLVVYNLNTQKYVTSVVQEEDDGPIKDADSLILIDASGKFG